jgi:hypothetical protein
MQAYEGFLKWLALAYPGTTVDEFLGKTEDAGLKSETANLGASLFATRQSDGWNGRQMAILLQRHRKTQYSRAARRRSLLKLNP